MTATKERKTNGIKFAAGELLQHLSAVMRAVPGHTPKPILQNVRIGDGLITGTDLELRIDRETSRECEPFLVNAARLAAILKASARDADVTLTPGKTSVTIKAGGGRWEIPTEDATEFPVFEAAGATPICRIPADQFVRAVKATVYATDQQSSRFALGSVLVEVADSNPTFVATDGRRLSAFQTETDQAVDDSTTKIPARAVAIMAALAAGEDGSVQLEATRSHVVCTVGGTVITAALTDGQFPRWRDVFPDRKASPSVVPVASLASAVRAAAICTSEASRGVEFTFGSILTLKSQSAEAGAATVTADITTPGDHAKVKLDPRFVTEFLAGLSTGDPEHVEIEAGKATDAVIFKCGDARGVIMPLSE